MKTFSIILVSLGALVTLYGLWNAITAYRKHKRLTNSVIIMGSGLIIIFLGLVVEYTVSTEQIPMIVALLILAVALLFLPKLLKKLIKNSSDK